MATKTKLTVEDYKVMPETGPRYQLIDGELKMSPAPNRYHQRISSNIQFLIRQWLESGVGEGAVYYAPFDVFLDEMNVFQPDLIYFRAENLNLLTDEGCDGAPDLVIEILSPGTRKIDLGPKKKIYAAKGVTELWIIDPEPRTVAIFHLQVDVASPTKTFAESDTVESRLLPGLGLAGEKIFAD